MHQPYQVAGGAQAPQKINLDESNWSLLGCRTSAKVTGKNIFHKKREISILMVKKKQQG
jgi:hypothetical protein